VIDWDAEDRLVRRIAAREALAGITPRQRTALAAVYHDGCTLDEAGQRLGVTRERVRQLTFRGIERAQARLRRPMSPTLAPVLRAAPEGFDRAAFLDHMRLLIRLRENKVKDLYRREQATLRSFLAREAERRQAAEEAARRYRQKAEEAARLQREWVRQRALEAERQRAVVERARLEWAQFQQQQERQRQQQQVQATIDEAAYKALRERIEWDRMSLMDRWHAIVQRHGWSEAEAAEHWQEWITGPVGLFG
jgi:hypothetical protein